MAFYIQTYIYVIRTFVIESKTYMYVIRTQRVNSFPAVRTATAKIPQAAHSGFYVHKKTQQYNKVTWLETTLFLRRTNRR